MHTEVLKKDTAIEKTQEPEIRTKSRLEYLDIAKGIGITMVVWAHAHGIGGYYFLSFAVPLFFFISGFLYNKELNLKEYAKRKFVSLYLPFLLCNLAWPTFVLYSRAHAGYPITNNIMDILQIALTLKKDGFLFGATWFLGSLFTSCISYKIIDVSTAKMKYKNYFILTFYALLAFTACEFMPFLGNEIRRILIVPLFFAIGAFIKANIGMIRKIDSKISLALAFLGVVISEVYLTKAGMVGYSYNAHSIINLTTFTITSFFSSYIIVYLSKVAADNIDKNKMNKVLSYIGKNSFYILLWHFVFFELLTALFLKVNNIPLYLIDRMPHAIKTNGIWWLVYFFIGIFGPLFLAKASKLFKRNFSNPLNLFADRVKLN